MNFLAFLIITFLVLLILGVPVAVSMAIASIGAIALGTNLPMVVVGQRMLVILDSFPFLALPFFIAAGVFMDRGGITRRLVNFAAIFVGRMTGGLAQVLIGTNLVMSGVSGAATADCAATSTVLIPAMKRAGYSAAFASALTAAAATVGPIIPPSIMFVIYGAITNVSIGALFLGGVLPGLLMGLYLMLAAYVISKRRGYPKMETPPWRDVIRITVDALPALIMPLIVLGGIVGGVFTPTEAGAVAAVYCFLVSTCIYRELKLAEVPALLLQTGILTAAVMLIVSAASLIGWLLARERVPDLLVVSFMHWTSSPAVFLAAINVVLLLLGFFFEAVSLLILVTPVIMPLVLHYGIDPVHFGVMMCLNLTLALIHPPVGMNMFIVCAIGKVSIRDYTREVIPFLVVLILALICVIYIPSLVLYLPHALGG
ncbi:MAG: TRAP transporter large permease [Pseudolabrys sp.]|jgi:C4-dicarboxylate transporter, DctM subunit